jgi:hypothetical protein
MNNKLSVLSFRAGLILEMTEGAAPAPMDWAALFAEVPFASRILEAYLWGSRVYGTSTDSSDFDVRWSLSFSRCARSKASVHVGARCDGRWVCRYAAWSALRFRSSSRPLFAEGRPLAHTADDRTLNRWQSSALRVDVTFVCLGEFVSMVRECRHDAIQVMQDRVMTWRPHNLRY